MTEPNSGRDRQAAELDAALTRAHEAGDLVGLARLYCTAAKMSEASSDVDEACYRYTQAYVCALDGGDAALAERLKTILIACGREE